MKRIIIPASARVLLALSVFGLGGCGGHTDSARPAPDRMETDGAEPDSTLPTAKTCPTGPGFLNDGGADYIPPSANCPCERPDEGDPCTEGGNDWCTYLGIHCEWQIVGYQYEHQVMACEGGEWHYTGQDCHGCCHAPAATCGDAVCSSDEYCLRHKCGVPCEEPPRCEKRPAGCNDCACLVQALGPGGADVCAGATPLCDVTATPAGGEPFIACPQP